MNLLDAQTSFITTLLNELRPENTLQLGLGNLDLTLSVCETLNTIDQAGLTLITPNMLQHSTFTVEVNKLKENFLTDLVELIRTPADEVLPDFYFQNRSVDLAIINDNVSYEQALVEFYYVDKMLVSRGTVIINSADNPVMRKLCRYLITERDYSLHCALNTEKKSPFIARLLRKQLNKAPVFVKERINTLVNAELLLTDDDLGLCGSTIALSKPAEEGDIEMDFDSLLESIINE